MYIKNILIFWVAFLSFFAFEQSQAFPVLLKDPVGVWRFLTHDDSWSGDVLVIHEDMKVDYCDFSEGSDFSLNGVGKFVRGDGLFIIDVYAKDKYLIRKFVLSGSSTKYD